MQDDVYEDEIEFDDPPIVEEIPSDELDNVAVASSPTSIKSLYRYFLLQLQFLILQRYCM